MRSSRLVAEIDAALPAGQPADKSRLRAILKLLASGHRRETPAPPTAADASNSGRPAGVAGNGDADDTAPLQAAIDDLAAHGGGILNLPAGIYKTSRALHLRSHVYIRGIGTQTIIRNTRTARTYIDRGAFVAGNHHPAAFDREGREESKYQRYRLRPGAAGATVLLLDDESWKFMADEPLFAFIISEEGSAYAAGTDRMFNPLYGQLMRVRILDRAVRLDRPLDVDRSDLVLCPVAGRDLFAETDWYVLQDAGVADLTVDAEHLFSRACTYECTFENLRVLDARTMLMGNAFTHTTIRGVRGTFSVSMIEIKSLSWGVTVSDCQGTYRSGDDREPYFPISIGECSRHVRLSRIQCLVGNDFPTAKPLVFIQEAENIDIDHCYFALWADADIPIVAVARGRFDGMPSSIRLVSNTFTGSPEISTAILLGAGTNPSTVVGVLVVGNTFHGLRQGGAAIQPLSVSNLVVGPNTTPVGVNTLGK